MSLFDKAFHKDLRNKVRATGRKIDRRPAFSDSNFDGLLVSGFVALIVIGAPWLLSNFSSLETEGKGVLYLGLLSVTLLIRSLVFSEQLLDNGFYWNYEHIPIGREVYAKLAIKKAVLATLVLLLENAVVVFISILYLELDYTIPRCLTVLVSLSLIQSGIALFAIRFLRGIRYGCFVMLVPVVLGVLLLGWHLLVAFTPLGDTALNAFYRQLSIFLDSVSRYLPTGQSIRYLSPVFNQSLQGIVIWTGIIAIGAISLMPYLVGFFASNIDYEQIDEDEFEDEYFPEVTKEELQKRNRTNSLLAVEATEVRGMIESLIQLSLNQRERRQLSLMRHDVPWLSIRWLIGWPVLGLLALLIAVIDEIGVIFIVLLAYYFYFAYPFSPSSLWSLVRPKERYLIQLKVYLMRFLTAIPVNSAICFAISKYLDFAFVPCLIFTTTALGLLALDRAFWKLNTEHESANYRVAFVRGVVVILQLGLWITYGWLTLKFFLKGGPPMYQFPIWVLGFAAAQVLLASSIIALQNRAKLTPTLDSYNFDE